MAERSPGDHDDHRDSHTDSGSSNNQPSSLPMTEDDFAGNISHHPIPETYQFINGLRFRIKGSQERCPSFTYASLPGVRPTPIEWKMCCDPDSDVGGEHVTYHTLTDRDDNLSTVVEYHMESNLIGLIIINNTNSTALSNDLVSRYVAPSIPVPLYIVSSRDGEQLRELVKAYNEGSVYVKVSVESAVDSVPAPVVPSGPPHPTPSSLQFRIRGSQERCPSFTYASLPGVRPTPIEWKMCCDPDSDVGGEHVTYHTLTDRDDNLSTVVEYHMESNLIGLIIINNTNSTALSNDLVSRYVAPSIPVPLYIVSSRDGEQLRELVKAYNEGSVYVKVSVESAVDSVPAPVIPSGPPHPTLSNRTDSQGTFDLPVYYSLRDELKKILYVKKKDRIHACVNPPEFQFVFSTFCNYEVYSKRESPEKAIKMLDNFTEETFNKDFLFYILLAYRFIVGSDVYGASNAANNYLIHCIEKFEAITDVQAMANVIFTFIGSGDFIIQFSVGPKGNLSVFQLLYHVTFVMLVRSNKLQEEKLKSNKIISNVVYRKMLWISLIIYFGLQVKVEPWTLATLWETELLNEQSQKELALSDDTVKEFAKGFEVIKALQLPESVHFDYSGLAGFFNPLKMKTLYVSHIMKLTNAGRSYLNWDLTFFCRFLPPLRASYMIFFNSRKKDWKRCSKEGTKIGVYKEILQFLEFLYNNIQELSKIEEDRKMADVIGTEITKWIELLVNNINMFANDAIHYLKELQSHSGIDKAYQRIITASIRTKVMEIVTQLTVPQFYTLFNDLQIWTFEFVEKFLNYYTISPTVDLKDSTWKVLLEEIVNRFSHVHCKSCIVGFIERVSKAYKSGKRQATFVLDLIKLDTPNLLLVQSYREDDPRVDLMFIEVVCTFIQKNALREVILSQVLTIMKSIKPTSHLHSLILAVMQKEVVPDSKMIEKLNSSNHLMLVLNASINAASASLTTLSQLSGVNKFYWHLIASFCSHVQLNAEKLSKLNTYLCITERLNNIFLNYCTKRRYESPPVILEIPQEINLISNTDVKDYFKWIIKMQSIVTHWRMKFLNEEFNYDDIFAYARNFHDISTFAKAVYIGHLTFTINEIAEFKNNYSAVYANLCLLLVKSNKEYGSWCTLVEMLSCYGIKFSRTLQAKLDTHLVLPERGPVITTDYMQQILHHQPIGQTELNPEITLRLKKSVTWKILQEIFNDLQIFLEPLMSHLEFLAYFHLHNCEMFSKHLKSQMAKLAAHSVEPVEESTIQLTLSFVGTTELSTEKLFQFATALQSTKDFILSLIKGTAKYAEIFAKGLLEEEFIQKFDMESEFKIMCAFPEFQEISAANEEGKEGIKHMLELFQYSEQISVIPKVCLQYQLVQCLQDPKLNELMDIVKSVKTAEDRNNVTGKMANDHMKNFWKILKFDDTSIAERCLKIFPSVANCTKFYQFIQNKGFANNTDAFRSQVDLIRALLQHEDYNETILNHLIPAFQCICPFLDKEQSLGSLMNKIIKLYHDGIGFGGDSRRDFCQLETVNSNIIMIQLWFFRTEEYCTGLIQEVRDQEKKATEALQSQLSQSQNKVEELTKDLTMERSVNETAKIEMENLTKQLQQLQNDKETLEQQINILQAKLEKALDPLENIEKLQEVVDLGVEIGRGAYGLVKKVSMHGTTCAAKDIHAILINYASDKELERITKSFLEECVKCSKLFHPNIVQFLGIHYPSNQAKLPWLVMELLDCSLTGFVEKYNEESVSQFVRASIFCDISRGLQFLHGQDIIHRDLSSNNILLTSHLTAKIADLGVAKLIDPDGSRSHTLAPGTKTFLPPEVFSAKPRYGKPVDVFSLGCIMIHVTTHQWPDPADETHYDEKLGKKVVLSEITRRTVYLNTIQGPIKILILSYLHDNPKQRPEIAVVVAELQKLKSSCQKPVSFNIVEFESLSKLQQKTNEQLVERQREMNEQLLKKQRELAEIKKTAQENLKRL